MNEKPTVFIVDDDPAACDSVAAMMASKGVAVKTYASAEAFLLDFDRRQFGCLVTDVRMGQISGLDLLQRLRNEKSDIPAVVITGYGDIPTAVEAMQLGAVTFLEKPCVQQELWENVESALNQYRQKRQQSGRRAELQARLATLTPPERLVLDRLVAGKANKVIAAELQIGLRTAELRRANAMKKLQAKSLAELVRLTLDAADEPNGEASPVSKDSGGIA